MSRNRLRCQQGGQVRQAALAIVRESDEAAALVQRVERAQAELADAGGALLGLVRSCTLPGRLPEHQRLYHVYADILGPVVAAPIARLFAPVEMWSGVPTTTQDTWTRALEELSHDAAAALPA